MNGRAARGSRAWMRAGDEPLAGAGLAGDEHRRRLVERGDLAGLFQHRPDRGRVADDAGRSGIRARPRGGDSRTAPAELRVSRARSARSFSSSRSTGFLR